MNKIIIIGGGPSGMMAAISAKMHNPSDEVILLEGNKELGRKLKLTGGGRCNVTANVSNEEVIKNVVKNGKFLYSTLSNFNTNDIISFFNDNNCTLKEEDHFRMFPITNKAFDIVNTLENKMNSLGVKIKFNQLVEEVTNESVITTVDSFKYDYLVIATGGITLPATGSNGSGHDFAKVFGHSITELIPAEVPLVSNDEVIQSKVLQGLSFNDVTISMLNDKGKIKRSITHDLLFTHFGLSGPGALRISFDVINELKKKEEVVVAIDFLPTFKKNTLLNELDKLDSIIKDNNLPERLIKYLKSISNSNEELVKLLKSFKITIYTTRGFKNAFVTNGGVLLKEVDPSTLKSKLNDRISFCGEVLDLNAYTGGFNITAALSTGFTAGKFIKYNY